MLMHSLITSTIKSFSISKYITTMLNNSFTIIDNFFSLLNKETWLGVMTLVLAIYFFVINGHSSQT